MEKLKNPKVIGGIAGVILAVLFALFADLKPIVAEICANAGVESVENDLSDLKE